MATGISTLGQALEQIERIKDQQRLFSTLSTQIATGKKTQVFSGLGTDVLTSQRARADFKTLDAYVNNITNADRRIKLMLNAIEEFQAQARTFSQSLVTFSQQSVHQEGEIVTYDDPLTAEIEATKIGVTTSTPDIDFRTLRALATNISDFMTSLMNAKEGDRYLLGGSETLTPPIADNGLLDTAVSTLLSGWKGGTIPTASLIADLRDRTTVNGNTDAITDTVVGYNAQLSAGNAKNVFARVDDNAEIDYTVLATESAFRDVIVAVSWIRNENLPPIADTYAPGDPGYPAPPSVQGAPGATLDEMKDNFFEVFNAVGAMVEKAIDNIDQLRFKLESARARIDDIKQSHKNAQNVLLSTVSGVEDIDTSEAAVKINALQVQLDASFRITARLQELSLVNFI